jgi:hypothetical protein
MGCTQLKMQPNLSHRIRVQCLGTSYLGLLKHAIRRVFIYSSSVKLFPFCGLYYIHIMVVISDACTIIDDSRSLIYDSRSVSDASRSLNDYSKSIIDLVTY